MTILRIVLMAVIISNIRMWKSYRKLIAQYPGIPLSEERRLIACAQKGSKKSAEEMVLRHINFIIFRLHKRVFPEHLKRFGEELLSEGILILYAKIKTYDLDYCDKHGNPKPVRFVSYIWKRIDGFIIDSPKKEFRKENSLLTLRSFK
ncbi:MAG: hypothetical protein A2036_00370 [Omnitrophica bacterium GWA2_50_21]|nr:MAG: hypothetical protein A2036_00370 [Omnitrophica bacterium GWA2_50_21]